MKLEDQVILEDQAHLLKTLGVVQKSLFYYHPAFYRPVFGETWTAVWGKQYQKTQVCNDKKASASAYTVGEMGLLLPPGFDTMYVTDEGYRGYDLEGEHLLGAYKSEAQCRAAMLIHLIQAKRVTAEECNQRLIDK